MGTICAILVEGIMRHSSVKLFYFEFGPVIQDMLFINFLSRALAALVFNGAKPFMQFW